MSNLAIEALRLRALTIQLREGKVSHFCSSYGKAPYPVPRSTFPWRMVSRTLLAASRLSSPKKLFKGSSHSSNILSRPGPLKTQQNKTDTLLEEQQQVRPQQSSHTEIEMSTKATEGQSWSNSNSRDEKNATPKEDSHSHDEYSHSHEHFLFHFHTHQRNELLSKGFLTNPAVRITWIGLIINVLMAGAKGLGGVYFHSQALVADAIHSISDTVADFLTLATVNVANKVGDTIKFPVGYGKIESVGTFLVSGVLLMAGLTIGWSSLLQIFEWLLPENVNEYLQMLQVHSHSHLGSPSSGNSHLSDAGTTSERQLPDINAAWLALASIGVKEILFRKTMKVASQTNSKVLVANAWHHRVDSLTASVAVVTVLLGVYFSASWLDAIGGLLVSAFIVTVGLKSLMGASYELIDRACDPKSEQFQQVKLVVEEATADVSKASNINLQVENFSLLTAGARSNVIFTIAAEGNPTLASICDMERDLITTIKLKEKSVSKVFVDYAMVDKERHEE